MHESPRSLLDEPLVLAMFREDGLANTDYGNVFWAASRQHCLRVALGKGLKLEDAEDVANDALVLLLCTGMRRCNELPAWIILSRLVLDLVANQRRMAEAIKRGGGMVVHSIDEFDELRATQESDVVEINDMNGRLHAALAKLSDRDELLVRLRWFEEMSLADIAQEAGYASADVVQVTLSRALDKLRRHLLVA